LSEVGRAGAGAPSAGPTVRRRAYVAGRVQGVWFRESCADRARAAGVAGWVRNLDDGRVEVLLEGPQGAVDDVLAWSRRGPRRARVDRVDVVDEAPVGERGFRVR
jgi:acylphosphatase